jgi:hypothetical protein
LLTAAYCVAYACEETVPSLVGPSIAGLHAATGLSTGILGSMASVVTSVLVATHKVKNHSERLGAIRRGARWFVWRLLVRHAGI